MTTVIGGSSPSVTFSDGTTQTTAFSSSSAVTSLASGTGVSVSGSTGGVTVTNTGVTSLAAGTGISVSGSTGGVTITNTGNGVGFSPQTWQNVTSSRSPSTTYTNSTSLPIAVSLYVGQSGGIVTLTIAGVAVCETVSGNTSGMFGIVQPGQTYSISASSAKTLWSELR